MGEDSEGKGSYFAGRAVSEQPSTPSDQPPPPPPLSKWIWAIIIGGMILIFLGCYVMYRISGMGQPY
jgi:hypothetical protein